jgi:predicted unusual protein kinase regulating ubiquinone biosynthesis (AarF/ABC1/UbiB family)
MMKTDKNTSPKIDLKRYRKVRWFFTKVLLQIIFWDILLNRPILKWFRPDPLPRWQAVARQYKEMAMEMGGVLIKLGQFLSIRVDILPPEVTTELADLQDEVAPETYQDIIREVENDFQASLQERFTVISPEPLGAASLAQAHLATLKSGEEVVIKILRPGIERLVETDLSVMNLVCRWLKLFKTIRSRADLDRLMAEFTKTTLNELDLIMERQNIEKFSEDFKDDPDVYIPAVFKDYSAPRTLTLENVFYIKITDIEGMVSCGVNCAEVADKLYNIYMKQIFVTNFIHADPHPGNLFVKPLPTAKEIKAGIKAFAPNAHVPEQANRPFQIVFIDFGMTAIIPERLKNAMRTAAIGIGTQDTRKVVQSYVMAGVLQPGADLRQIEIIHEDWFQRLWGIQMGRLQEVAFKEASYFLKEYRDLIMEMPFQFQVDLLFIGRAVGILAGISTKLDPEFDPWKKTIPYAKKFAIEELKADWQGWPEEIIMLGQHMLKIPSNLGQVLTKAKQGALSIRVSLSPETRRAIRRIDISVKRFSWTVLATGLLVCGVNLHIAGKGRIFGIILILLAVLSFLWGMRRS